MALDTMCIRSAINSKCQTMGGNAMRISKQLDFTYSNLYFKGAMPLGFGILALNSKITGKLLKKVNLCWRYNYEK